MVVQVDWFPEASVTMRVTVFTPTSLHEKVKFGYSGVGSKPGDVKLNVSAPTSVQLSVLPLLKKLGLRVELPCAFSVTKTVGTLALQLATGGVLSTKFTVMFLDVGLPQASVAVTVTVIDPPSPVTGVPAAGF